VKMEVESRVMQLQTKEHMDRWMSEAERGQQWFFPRASHLREHGPVTP
jgi:hypothetical protein